MSFYFCLIFDFQKCIKRDSYEHPFSSGNIFSRDNVHWASSPLVLEFEPRVPSLFFVILFFFCYFKSWPICFFYFDFDFCFIFGPSSLINIKPKICPNPISSIAYGPIPLSSSKPAKATKPNPNPKSDQTSPSLPS